MLTALHVFETAGFNFDWDRDCGGCFFFNADGAWRDKSVHVRAIQASLLVYEKQLNDVCLACADTTVSTEQVKQQIEMFKKAAVGLHRAPIKATAERMFTHGTNLPSPWRKIGVRRPGCHRRAMVWTSRRVHVRITA
jgi:hypothetical protein